MDLFGGWRSRAPTSYSNCCNFATVLLWHENRAEVSYLPYQLRRLGSPTFVLEFVIHGWGTLWLRAATPRDDWHLAFDFLSFSVWFCLLLITLIGCCGLFDALGAGGLEGHSWLRGENGQEGIGLLLEMLGEVKIYEETSAVDEDS